MYSLRELNEIVNHRDFDDKKKWGDDIIKRRDVYYGMSLHIDGACPAWYAIREPRYGWIPGNLIEKRPLLGWYGYEYHEIFNEILFNRYPNEPERTRQFRFSQYKPFQKNYFDRCIEMVTGAIFQDSGFNVTVSDKSDNDYVWGNNFSGKNIFQYLSESFKTIAADPNGLFLVIPKKSGKEYQDETGGIEPDVWFIQSKELRLVTKDEIVFERGKIRWAVNKFGYFRWEQKENEWVLIEPEGYYPHMLGYVPAFVAGGKFNNQGFYESWLNAGKAIADDYVIIKSDEAMCAKQASHPWIIEANTECPESNCRHGQIQFCNHCKKSGDICSCDEHEREISLINCGTCNGTGHISRNPGDRLTAPKEDMELDLVKVVNIPVDANKMHAERAANAEISLQKSLHLDYIDQAQSGVAKEKDLMMRFQFIMNINNDYFDRLIPKIINAITSLRNISVVNGNIIPTPTDVTIVKPTQFQIKTSYDLLDEMKVGKESGIPTYQYNALIEDYVEKQFGGNEVLKRKTILINQMDKLAGKSMQDIALCVLNGFANQRDGQFNVVLPAIIDEIVRTRGDEWFLKAPYDQIETLAINIFNTKYPPVIALDPPVLVREEI